MRRISQLRETKRTWCGALLFPLLTGVLVFACVAEASTRSFVVTAFAPAVYAGKNPCPEGFSGPPDIARVLAKLSPEEGERIMRPEHTFALCQAYEGGAPPSTFRLARSQIS